MQAHARTDTGWPSPPARRLPRDSKEEARSRRPARSDIEHVRYGCRRGIGNAQEFPAGAEGERALMRAVLVDAIRCLVGEVTPFAERTRLAGQARSWVGSRDERWPFSFENVCASLDLQASRLRTVLLGPTEMLRRTCRTLVERLAP